MGKKKLSFEEALKELETIAEKIERGEIGLEESITLYERGMALVKQCRDLLARAEQRIQQLHERADGTLEPRPLSPPSPEDTPQDTE
ncbi:MAG: exodeoxyribonuclease VII small subunit [Planctomycetota bacterium]|nr:MAG: exodeoxyribonuclease VII small subunit [Planctomycetota bacterium]